MEEAEPSGEASVTPMPVTAKGKEREEPGGILEQDDVRALLAQLLVANEAMKTQLQDVASEVASLKTRDLSSPTHAGSIQSEPHTDMGGAGQRSTNLPEFAESDYVGRQYRDLPPHQNHPRFYESNDRPRMSSTPFTGQYSQVQYEDRPFSGAQLNKPAEFSGESRDVPLFLAQVAAFAARSPSTYRTDEQRVALATSLFRGDAARWWAPYYLQDPQPVWFFDWKLFVNKINATFRPMDATAVAVDKMVNLRQTGTVTAYYQKFHGFSVETGWNDKSLRDQFRRNLKDEIRAAIAALPEQPETLEAMAEVAGRIDGNMAIYKHTSTGLSPFNPHVTKTENTKIKNTSSGSSSRRFYYRQKGSGSSSRTIKTENTKNNDKNKFKYSSRPVDRSLIICYLCNEKGHFASECRKTAQKSARATTVAEEASVSELTEEEEDTEETHEVYYGAIRVPQQPFTEPRQVLTKRPHIKSNQTKLHKKAFSFHITVVSPSAPTCAISALLDSGAESNLIDSSVIRTWSATTYPLSTPIALRFADGRVAAKKLVQGAKVQLLIGPGFPPCTVTFVVVHHHLEPMTLGSPFLEQINPIVDWVARTMTPRSPPVIQYARAISAITLTPSESSSIASIVPSELYGYLAAFSEKEADQLPRHGSFDHAIDLVPGTVPTYGPIYSLSVKEQDELRRYLDDMLEKGFIQESKSSCSSPILFVKKKDGSLRLCVDYRRLNAITVKNRYPLPLIRELLDRLSGSTWFSKIDLRGAYNLVRIKEGHEWLTAFTTRFGLFEYKVMPFGLTNAPATFQRLMNHIFHDMLDRSVIVYLDDIMVFTKTRSEHTQVLKEVLRRLLDNRLYAKHTKCEFYKDRLEFLGYVISTEGTSMDPAKVKAISDWPYPSCVRDVQSFVGLVNFYHHLIPGFATMCRPLYELMKKDVSFEFTNQHRAAWDLLKAAACNSNLVRHYDPILPCTVDTDASDFAIGAVFSQSEDGVSRPVAYFSRKLTGAELNYPVHDKEFLAIFAAFKEWRHYLEGAQVEVHVYSDHRSLEYYTTSKALTRRQARWMEFMADFAFTIHYRPGKQQVVPDALSRRPDHEGSGSHVQTIALTLDDSVFRIAAVQVVDNYDLAGVGEIFMADELQPSDEEIDQHHLVQGRRWFYRDDKRFVPQNLRGSILKLVHNHKSSGHPGRDKTISAVGELFWWPQWQSDVKDYVRDCFICQRTKTSHERPAGLLQPLPVADAPFQHITVDMIGELPPSKLPNSTIEFNAIVVFVDRFTKMIKPIATTTSLDAAGFATIFFERIYCEHGLPRSIVSDRGSLFTSRFWRTVADTLDIQHRLSTAYHPQTDGQTEIVNQWLEQYLRVYTNFAQDDWASLLPHAQFCYNNTVHSAIKMTPYEALVGIQARKGFDNEPTKSRVGAPLAIERVNQLHELHTMLRQTLEQTRQRYSTNYNRKHRDLRFEVGDWVLLRTKNIKTIRFTKKLDDRFAGPYRIKKIINPVAYELELDNNSRIWPVFHVSLLKPFHGKPEITRPTVFVDDQPKPIQILRQRKVRDQTQYLVKWDGAPEVLTGIRRSENESWETDITMTRWDETWSALKHLHAQIPPPKRTHQNLAGSGRTQPGWKGWVPITNEQTPLLAPNLLPPTSLPRTRLKAKQQVL